MNSTQKTEPPVPVEGQTIGDNTTDQWSTQVLGPYYCEPIKGSDGTCIPCSVDKSKIPKLKKNHTVKEKMTYQQLLDEFKFSCQATSYHSKMRCFDLHLFSADEASSPSEPNPGRISYQSCVPLYESTYECR